MVKYQKFYAICGMLGPILYAMIWILGGILQPGHDHIRDDVSSLLAVGAPFKLLFDIIHITDVILMIIFFIGLILVMREVGGSVVGPSLFLIANIVELIVGIFFPLDYGGEPTTIIGQMHVILVMSMSFLSMGGMLAMFIGLRKVEEWKGYHIFSLVIFVLTVGLGLLAAMTMGSEIMGLTERLVVTTIGVYFFVIALKTYRTANKKGKGERIE